MYSNMVSASATALWAKYHVSMDGILYPSSWVKLVMRIGAVRIESCFGGRWKYLLEQSLGVLVVVKDSEEDRRFVLLDEA